MSKKIQFFLIVLTLLAAVISSNAQSFAKQQMDINFGVGVGNTFIQKGAAKSFPVLSTSLDYGVTDAISVGAYLGYASATYNYTGTEWHPAGNGVGNAYGNYYTYTDTYKWKFSIVGARGAYHFAKFINNDKVDLYAGLMLGANFAKYTFTTNSAYPEHTRDNMQTYSGLIWSGFLGCRYRFTDMVGVFGELGYGISYLNLGLNFKF